MAPALKARAGPPDERMVHELLGRSAMLRATAAGFAHPDPGHLETVRRMLAETGLPAASEASPIQTAHAAAMAAWREAGEPDLAAEYVRLFLAAPACPPHETAYGDGRRIAGRAAELADIAAFYRAFGLENSGPRADLPDHIACELEFLSAVLVKLAYAEFQGWTYRCEVTTHAAASFLEQHLGRWTQAFAAALAEKSALPAYRALGDLAAALVAEECRLFGVAPVLLEGRLPNDEMQDETLVCPRAEDSEED